MDRHLATCAFVLLNVLAAEASAQDPAPTAPLVKNIRIRSGGPEAPASTTLPAGTTAVTCAFEVEGVVRGTAIQLRWELGDEELTRAEFLNVVGDSSLSSSLGSTAALEPGQYHAEVLIDDVPAGRIAFTIEAATRAARRDAEVASPSVSDLVLTTESCDEARAQAGTGPLEIYGTPEGVSLCLRYEGMGDGRRLQVRWFHDVRRSPITVSTFTPAGAGELEAAYLPEGVMAPGRYHVVVMVDGLPVQRVGFVVAI